MITRPLGSLRLSMLGLDGSQGAHAHPEAVERARAAGVTWVWLPAGTPQNSVPEGFLRVIGLDAQATTLPRGLSAHVVVAQGPARPLPELVAARQSGALGALLGEADSLETLAQWLARVPQLDGVVARFHALADSVRENGLCDALFERQLGLLALDPLDGGALAQNHPAPCPPPPDASAPDSQRRAWAQCRLAAYASENDLHPAELATGLIAATPGIVAMAYDPAHLPSNLDLGDLGLPARTRPISRALKAADWYHNRERSRTASDG